MSQRTRILAVALTLPQPFRESDLIVAVWRRYPIEFGLPGYQDQHPNSNAVKTKLFGASGLIARGELEAVESGVYRVAGAIGGVK